MMLCGGEFNRRWTQMNADGAEVGGQGDGGRGDGLRVTSDEGGEGEKHSSLCEAELRKDEFWAVKDVSFELRRGECLGLIGHNGAGKSTLLKMLNGIIKPDHGRIEMRGRVAALIELGVGFNSVLTGRENIYKKVQFNLQNMRLLIYS